MGLILSNGTECVFVTGPADTIHGMRINYYCGKGWIVGETDTTHGLWRVRYATHASHPRLQWLAVIEAFY